MQLLCFWTLLLLISTSYGVGNDTTLSSGLVANPMSKSVVIDMPACMYSMNNATLTVSGPNSTSTYSFIVPQCRPKRDLVVLNNNTQTGNLQTINVGYQVKDLIPATNYTAVYNIGTTNFIATNFTTSNGISGSTPPDIFARSGGMIVITVILSVAMVLLLVGLITVLVLGGRGTK